MVNFKEDERLNTLNHSCAHVMAQAVKHLYPHAKFWVGPVVKEGFYYDIDLGDNVINDEALHHYQTPDNIYNHLFHSSRQQYYAYACPHLGKMRLL